MVSCRASVVTKEARERTHDAEEDEAEALAGLLDDTEPELVE